MGIILLQKSRNVMYTLFVLLVGSLFVNSILYAKEKTKYYYKNKQIRVMLLPRSIKQMAAFYEGRGFSRKMIEKLTQPCFITVGIHNKTKDVLWHNLKNWKFTNSKGEILPFNRDYWKATWKKMGISLAHQSTFRWTLLPETLDFRSDEHEGGNITLPYFKQPFTLQAQFKTKKDKSGKPITIKIENIQCIR